MDIWRYSFNLHLNLKNMRYLSILFLSFASSIYAQIGGNSTFDFLQLSGDPYVSALGGENVSSNHLDVNMQNYNPSLIRDTMSGRVAFSIRNYYADIKRYGVSSVFGGKSKFGPFGASLQYLNYGKINSLGPNGEDLGEVFANEYVFGVSKSIHKGPFSMGSTLKFAHSQLAQYKASALLLDIGGSFQHKKQDWTIGFVVKNVGGFTKRYYDGENSSLPFDMQLGTSYKLKHMPLRISLTFQKLYKWDIQYLDPTKNIAFGEDGVEIIPSKSFSEKLLRHCVFAAELPFGKKFHFRMGYNYLRRRELKLQELPSAWAGFNWGFMLVIKGIECNYTRSSYHVVGPNHVFGVGVDINRFLTKNKTKKTDSSNQIVE